MTSIELDQLAGTWQFGPAPRDYVLSHVRAVTADRVSDDSWVVVREGRIADIRDTPVGDPRTVDGNGLLLIPGIVDIHCDSLENELMPRPNAPVPGEFALTSLEGRLVGAGITTIYHGVRFGHQGFRGGPRDIDTAQQMCDLIDATVSYRVDHRVLHRMDVLSAPGAEALTQRLATLPAGEVPPLVSHEDHTPGQGQYADPQHMINYNIHKDGMTPEAARENVARLIREGAEKDELKQANLDWLGRLAGTGEIRLAGHDPDTPEVVDGLVARHCVAAEFPTTLEAARAARRNGLQIVAGAPNLLRGHSHAGNLSARELAAEGLLDALASDYLPTALLGSAGLAARTGLVDLPTAVGWLTRGPAEAAGLTDRGDLREGLRADFALVDDSVGSWPRPVTTLFAAG